MFEHSLLGISKFYLILIICVAVLNHTVFAASSPMLQHNDLLSKENKTELIKREDKIQDNLKTGNQSRNISSADDKIVPAANNDTTNKHLPVGDMYNSTANLPPWMLNIKNGALQRTGYVALGIMFIVVLFFVVRAVRLRHKKSKSRKYGVITSTMSDMEMEPLDKDEDEEEDTTLFDAQHKYSLQ